MVTNSLSFVSQLSIVQLAHYQSMILLNDKYAGKKLENRLPAQRGYSRAIVRRNDNGLQ